MNKKQLTKNVLLTSAGFAALAGSTLATMPNVLAETGTYDHNSLVTIDGNISVVHYVDGKIAYCIDLGKAPVDNVQMHREQAVHSDHLKRFIYAAYGVDGMGFIAQTGVSKSDAIKISTFAAHVAEHEAFPGDGDDFTWTEFRDILIRETQSGRLGTAGLNYGTLIFDYIYNGKLPNTNITVTAPADGGVSHYNAATNRLETGLYTVNDVESQNITVTGLPEGVKMLNEAGAPISALSKNQKFYMVTDNLKLNATLGNILAQTNIREVTPIIYQAQDPNLQRLVQAGFSDPVKNTQFGVSFKSVLGNIKFTKIDSRTKAPIGGMKFEIFKADGTTKVADAVSNAQGIVEVRDLLMGDYVVKEVPTKGDGYVDKVVPYTVTVVPDVDTPVNNGAVPNDETETKITKTDLGGKELEGAKLVLKDKDGKVVDEWTSGKEVHTIYKLPEGEYTLTETFAPDRYILSQTIKFTVKEDGSVVDQKMVDEYTELKVIKRDGNTGKRLAGAKFGLYDNHGKLEKMMAKDGNLVDAIAYSDENGEAIFKGITRGDHVVKELESPAGYSLNSDMQVNVDDVSGTVRDFVDYKNPTVPKTPETPVLPKTANPVTVESNIIIPLAGGSFAAVLATAAFKRKKSAK